MKAIILAAGRGSRLLTLTDDRPKCLVKLHGKPLINWQVEALQGSGIKEILVVRGYLKDMISGDFETRENPRWSETNMVASMMCAKDWLEDSPCIVSYSDIIYPSEAVLKLMATSHPLSMLYDTNWKTLWEKRFDDPLSDAESFALDENGFVRDIGRPNVSLDEIHGQYMGLLKFTPESTTWLSELLDNNQKLCDTMAMTDLLSTLIKQSKSVAGIPWDGTWCEVDDQKDLKVAEELFIAKTTL